MDDDTPIPPGKTRCVTCKKVRRAIDTVHGICDWCRRSTAQANKRTYQHVVDSDDARRRHRNMATILSRYKITR